MTFTPETITIQDVLSLTRYLSDEDRQWLAELLNRLDDAPLPTEATLDEAITLYLADACSLGRAAELAGVTRWDIMDELAERGIPLLVHGDQTPEEMDAFAEQLEREGFL